MGAKITVNAVGCIEKGMDKSSSKQTTRGTILDETGKIEANPVLLIDNNDVSASHAAAIGKISDEGLFYLMSRGLSKKDAEKLIIAGFVNPMIKSIEDSGIRNLLSEVIDYKLR